MTWICKKHGKSCNSYVNNIICKKLNKVCVIPKELEQVKWTE